MIAINAPDMPADHTPPYILYDGECPFCTGYVRMLRLREAMEGFTLYNAREYPDLVKAYAERGLDVDDGMIMAINGQAYYGDEVVHQVALMSTSSRWLNRLNASIFGNPTVSRVLYPIMRAGRNMTLRLLGRQRILSE